MSAADTFLDFVMVLLLSLSCSVGAFVSKDKKCGYCRYNYYGYYLRYYCEHDVPSFLFWQNNKRKPCGLSTGEAYLKITKA